MGTPKYKVGDHVVCMGYPTKEYNGKTATVLQVDSQDLQGTPYYVEWHDLEFEYNGAVGWMKEMFLHPVELIKSKLIRVTS